MNYYAIVADIPGPKLAFMTAWLDTAETVKGLNLFPSRETAESYVKAFEKTPGCIHDPLTGLNVKVKVVRVDITEAK